MSVRYSSLSEEVKSNRVSNVVRQSDLLKHLQNQHLQYFNRESLRERVKKLQPPVRRLQHLQNLKKKADEYNQSNGQYLKDCLKHIVSSFHYYRDIKSQMRSQDLYLAIMVNFIQRAIEGGQNCLHDLLQIVNESVARSNFVMGQYKMIILGYLKQLYFTLNDFTQVETLSMFYEMLLYSEQFHLILSQVVKSMVINFYKRVQARSIVQKYPAIMNDTKIEFYFQQTKREDKLDNIILHTVACILRININIHDFSDSGGPIAPEPQVFSRMRFSSMLADSHLSLLNNMEDKTITILRYQANENKRYAVLYEPPTQYPLAREIYKQWNTGVISHVFKQMLPFKEFSRSSYVGTNLENLLPGGLDSSSISGSDQIETQIQQITKIKLNCGHSFNKHDLRFYLKEQFVKEANELNPHIFYQHSSESKSRPTCRVCQSFMTYEDLHTIYDKSLLDKKFYAFIENDWNHKDVEVRIVKWPKHLRNTTDTNLTTIVEPTNPNTEGGMIEPDSGNEITGSVQRRTCTRREKWLIGGIVGLAILVVAFVIALILIFVF